MSTWIIFKIIHKKDFFLNVSLKVIWKRARECIFLASGGTNFENISAGHRPWCLKNSEYVNDQLHSKSLQTFSNNISMVTTSLMYHKKYEITLFLNAF